MDLLEAIFSRRSIRKYSGEPITEEDLTTVLKAGFHAPSAHNHRPWEFIIVKDKKKFEQIAQIHSYAKMLPQADVCIFVCGDQTKESMIGFLVEDCSAAIQNMLLAAHGIGLGAVWCGIYPVTGITKKIKKILDLPPAVLPVGMIVLGHKGEDKAMDDRYDAVKVHYEQW